MNLNKVIYNLKLYLMVNKLDLILHFNLKLYKILKVIFIILRLLKICY